MAAEKKKKIKKNIKKSFYEISAPLTSTRIELYASSPEELDGKTIKIDLTKSLRGKSFELKLRIKNKDNSLVAEPESLILVMSYVRKIMRKGSDYVEDSFATSCRDASVQIKPLLVTRRRVSRAILKALRDSTRKQLESHLKTRSTKEIFSEIITNKLQKQLSLKLKKIYPLALCEIRSFEILNQKQIEQKPSEEKTTEEL